MAVDRRRSRPVNGRIAAVHHDRPMGKGVDFPMDWRHRAACLDEDPELFFPIGNTGPALLQIEEAKAVCRRCDVLDTCLRWALETGQDAGVWGGLSEDERRALKRRNARARRAG
jgi:WhiB family redox-sensing transcriptional regulator